MHVPRIALSFLGLAMLLAACESAPLAAPTAAKTAQGGTASLSYYMYNDQIGIDFLGNHLLDNASTKAAGAGTFGSTGLRWARIDAYWPDLQRDSTSNFTTADLTALHETVTALTNAGITPYITIQGTPCWARVPLSCDPTKLPNNTAHWEANRNFVKHLMHEFPTIQYWSLWNEPNAGGLISDGSSDRLVAYEQFVDSIAPILHDSLRTVIAPELANALADTTNGYDQRQWLDHFLQDKGSLVDIVAVHLYGGTGDGGLWDMQQFDTIVGNRRPTADLWLTEAGFPTGNPNDADQEHNLYLIYNAMFTGGVSRWKKTFYYSAGYFAGATDNRGLVYDLGLSTATTRPAYDCLAWMATRYGTWSGLHLPPSPIAGCS